MSEKMHHAPEHKQDVIDTSKESAENLKRLKHEAEKHSEKNRPNTEVLQQQVKQEAISAKEFSVGENEQPRPVHHHGSQRELKAEAYKRTLTNVRTRLSRSERTFSKITHQPTVDAVSNGAGKTIARPSGILGAGIAAFAGSGLILFLSYKYGFAYNYTVFLAFLIGGYIIGLIAELIVRAVHKTSRR